MSPVSLCLPRLASLPLYPSSLLPLCPVSLTLTMHSRYARCQASRQRVRPANSRLVTATLPGAVRVAGSPAAGGGARAPCWWR
eukprot:1739120-Pleurochrysis_carterae.AAC.3